MVQIVRGLCSWSLGNDNQSNNEFLKTSFGLSHIFMISCPYMSILEIILGSKKSHVTLSIAPSTITLLRELFLQIFPSILPSNICFAIKTVFILFESSQAFFILVIYFCFWSILIQHLFMIDFISSCFTMNCLKYSNSSLFKLVLFLWHIHFSFPYHKVSRNILLWQFMYYVYNLCIPHESKRGL